MCGIMGIACYGHKLTIHKLNNTETMTKDLLIQSQRRGSDATGICVLTRADRAYMFKDNVPAREFVKRPELSSLIGEAFNYRDNLKAIIGHTRAQTKGTHMDNYNNHPIRANDVIGVHNGCIGNDEHLFKSYEKYIERAGRVDSEIIFRLVDHYAKVYDLVGAAQKTAHELTGSFSCAFLHLKRPNYLTLFAGRSASIHIMDFQEQNLMVFASTKEIIEAARKNNVIFDKPTDEMRVKPDGGVRINLKTGGIYRFDTNKLPEDPKEDDVKKVEQKFNSIMTGAPLHQPFDGPTHH